MFTRHTFLRTAVVAANVTAALAACGQMKSSGSSTASGSSTETFEARLTGAQEVPPVNSPGTGAAEVQLNKSTNTLTWKVTYSGLTGPAVAGHIHGPAAAGANAGVVVPFTNITAQPVTGQATITPAEAADLAAGKWYANIHTAANPGGEIRGQLQKR
jgi:hypothetical protein